MIYDLVIATTTYFGTYDHVKEEGYRLKLWKQMLQSLAKTEMNGAKVALLIADDHSQVDIQEWRSDLPFRYNFYSRPKHIGWNANQINNLNTASEMAPICLSVDSDGYFHPQWLLWLFDTVTKYPDAAGWNLFNSPRHQLITDRPDPDILEKSSTQLHGLAYYTRDRKNADPKEWVESFTGELLLKHGNKFIVPEISMIQHTGCYGINNVPGGSQDYDPRFLLNHECGLGDWNDRSGFPKDYKISIKEHTNA